MLENDCVIFGSLKQPFGAFSKNTFTLLLFHKSESLKICFGIYDYGGGHIETYISNHELYYYQVGFNVFNKDSFPVFFYPIVYILSFNDT